MIYQHPGVYVHEIEGGARPIEMVGTSTAAFVGPTPQNTGPNTPTRITGFDQYVETFVEPSGGSEDDDFMLASVRAFFQNGGRVAYVVRVPHETAAAVGVAATGELKSRSLTTGGRKVLDVTANAPGQAANALAIRVVAVDPQETTLSAGTFDFLVGSVASGAFVELERFAGVSFNSGSEHFVEGRVNTHSSYLTVKKSNPPNTTDLMGADAGVSVVRKSAPLHDVNLETLEGREWTVTLTTDGGTTEVPIKFTQADVRGRRLSAEDIAKLLEPHLDAASADWSVFASAGQLVIANAATTASAIELTGPDTSSDASKLMRFGDNHGGEQGTKALLATIPVEAALGGGQGYGEGSRQDYAAALKLLEKREDVSIVCLPTQHLQDPGNLILSDAVAHADKLGDRMVLLDPPASLDLAIPSAEAILAAAPSSPYAAVYYPWVRVGDTDAGQPRHIPPSGFVAGVWARTDARRGVWKAPAGTEASLYGLSALQYQIDDVDQDALNPIGVNCLRLMGAYGTVVWGARTRAGASSEWRYLPIRRTAIMLRESIQRAIQWAVFEPNNEALWAALRLSIGSFMNDLFRAGAFQGARASEAYFVRCKLDETMKQSDIDAGKVIVHVGFAPVKPAEFVIVQIQQKINDPSQL